jgi:hypothetical protein
MVEGGRIALCDIATFQEFTGQFGLADRIDLKLEARRCRGRIDHPASAAARRRRHSVALGAQ